MKLTTNIATGFTNEFKGGYNHYNYNYHTTSNSSSVNSVRSSVDKANNIFFSDDIRYHKTWGNWTIEPKAGISYQRIAFSQDSTSNSQFNYQTTPSIFTYKYTQSTKWWTITPDIILSYKQDLNITAGAQYYTSFSGHNPLKLYPFVSASVNVVHLLNQQSNINFMLFGSYSRSVKLYNETYNLTDYDRIPYSGTYFNDPVPIGVLGAYVYNGTINTGNNNNNYSAGARFITANNRLSVSYQFEARSFLTAFPLSVPNGSGLGYALFFFNSDYKSNYLGISYKIFDTQKLNWDMGINASAININYSIDQNYVNKINAIQVGNGIKTGGWVNRINAGKLIAGLDVLYQFGGHLYNSTDNINSFNLQNVYLGAKFKTDNGKIFELYASGRNVLQNNQSIITDGRRFFGLGFKAGL